jgi:ubiquinone/menaquinone biosynthesis C-methylase UbiE
MKSEFDHYAGDYQGLLKDPIRDSFAKSSAFFHLRKWLLLEDFLRQSKLGGPQARWLDIGCGQGELLQLGRAAFGEVSGCDPSAEMLAGCGDLKVEVQTDLLKLPYPDQSFDLATAVCVYHHVPPEDRPALTNEVVRVLKPGGVFCIIEHNPYNPATQLIVKRAPIDANAILLTARETASRMRAAKLEPFRTTYFLYITEGLYKKFGGLEKYLEKVPMGGQYAQFGRKAR